MKSFKMRLIHFLGACYVCLAVVAATTPVQNTATPAQEPGLVHTIGQAAPPFSGSLWSREGFTLEVWGTSSCSWCTKLKPELVKLEKLGYKVRKFDWNKDPRPKEKVKGFPTIFVRYQDEGETKTLLTITGYMSAQKIDDKIMDKALDILCPS